MPKNVQTTAQLHSSHLLAGEGNGTPLQYSCLENPMDGGAWKAAVHGVAEGRTQLNNLTLLSLTLLICKLKLEILFHLAVLLLLLSRFSRVRLCASPFSRQEHWSGLPFPSPMHDSEK